MRKQLVLVIFMVLVFMVATLPVMGSSADDYKVIKNAVKTKSDNGEVQFFKITIYDKKEDKNTVNITLPLAVLELLSNCSESNNMVNISELKGKCKDFDLKKFIDILKKNGPMTLIEIDDKDSMIKLWFE